MHPVSRWLGPSAVGMLAAPLAFYLVAFVVLTFPLITQFSTHIFADQGDGLQNYWNLWWMKKSLLELRQPFWKTPYLHYPYGTSLLGHTLNPFNGLMGIPLSPFFSLVQIYNAVVVFSFVVGGLTAFWLAYYITRAYVPSLVGGYVFTFSNYHFAHAEGHMQLVSLEWIPLFALLWLRLLEKPRVLTAVGAVLALFGVALCDYYYLFYCVLFGLLALGWRAWRNRGLGWLATRPYLVALSVFSVLALSTAGPMVISLLLLAARDPLVGAHPTLDLSLDLPALLIPGGHWRFAELTAGYWSRLPGFIHESSVHVGLSVLVLAVLGWRGRRAFPGYGLGLWWLVLAVFVVLSLGPALHVGGVVVTGAFLPYAWLEAVFPPLALSGVPVRMMVMVTLALGVLAAAGLKRISMQPGKRFLALALVALMAVEYLPRAVPASRPAVPGYVRALAALNSDGKGVLDTVSNQTLMLYYQTIHEKPLALGYVARIPKSVTDVDFQLRAVFDQRDFAQLRDVFGIRYVVARTEMEPPRGVPARTLYEDPRVRIYDLGP